MDLDFENIIEEALVEKKEKISGNKKINSTKNTEVNYEIIKEIARISSSKNWDIVVAEVKWGTNAPKYEIRRWSKNGSAGKGVTFTEKQFQELIKGINNNYN